ncbi:unnamed protein product [Auanema sp. JU1783]|nr:unnamed protein product [Auanema sp. JU1783]
MTDIIPEEDGLRNRSDSLKALSVNSDSCNDSCLGYSEEDEPALDQKHLNLIHEELEKLNIATDVINKLEVQLDVARADFREVYALWTKKLKDLSKKYKSAIEKARPYYEAKLEKRKIAEDSHRSTTRFGKATEMLDVAKTQVNLTQDSLSRANGSVQTECLEVLNHHISRVNEAEEERVAAQEEHRENSARMMEISDRILKMYKDNRSSIEKAKTYFEERQEFTKKLEKQKHLIQKLETEVRQKKCDYTTSLRNLEKISDSIHEQRSLGGGSMIIKSEVPQNPPPYIPTAPPPYEDDERYTIEQDEDDVIEPVFRLMRQQAPQDPSEDERNKSGVILSFQQFITNREKKEKPKLPSFQPDVSYRTRPEGICSSPDSSDVLSLASSRLSEPDDEAITGMIRSHSTFMKEMEAIEQMLHRSVSDVEPDNINQVSLPCA